MREYEIKFKCSDGNLYKGYRVMANKTEVVGDIKNKIKNCEIVAYDSTTTNGWGKVVEEETHYVNMGSIIYFTIKEV